MSKERVKMAIKNGNLPDYRFHHSNLRPLPFTSSSNIKSGNGNASI